MARNFDRATIFQLDCPAHPVASMTEREFADLVTRGAPDLLEDAALARAVIRRCYRNISPLDADRREAYEDARECARGEIRARHARAHALGRATRSAAPATRGAPLASMPDRRGGAEDVGAGDGFD